MKLKKQKINNEEFKWSAELIKFILESWIKEHIQQNNINKHSITYAKWGQKLTLSWLLYTNLRNKAQ